MSWSTLLFLALVGAEHTSLANTLGQSCSFRIVNRMPFTGTCRRNSEGALYCHTRIEKYHHGMSRWTDHTALCLAEGDECEDAVQYPLDVEHGICRSTTSTGYNIDCVSVDHTLINSLWCGGTERYLFKAMIPNAKYTRDD